MLVRNGHVVTESGTFVGDVLIVDGVIVAIGHGLSGDTVIDAEGCWVLPGIVDAHVHTRIGEHSMGDALAEDLPMASRTALHGGVTTICAYAHSTPDASAIEVINEQIELGRSSCSVDFALNAFVRPADDIEATVTQGAALGVMTFKAQMAYHSRGMMQEDDSLFRIMRAVSSVGGLTLVHPENGRMVDELERVERAGGSTHASLLRSAPGVLEAEGMFRAATIAGIAECPVLFVHLSARESVALAEWLHNRPNSNRIFWETQPHFLVLSNDLLATRGALAKIGPPLREDEDIAEVWRALENGILSHITSDHTVRTAAVKLSKPDILDAPYGGFGCTGLLLPLTFALGVQSGRFGIEDLVRLIATNPAKRYGLYPRKGVIQPGADGDLVVLPMDGPAVPLVADNIPGAADYSLYEEIYSQGFPRDVIRAGTLALRNGEVLENPPARYLARTSAGG